jgi:antimicrobial peptide system SdpB family protein
LIAVAVLLVVAIGWRPRFTGVVHWWLSLSFQLTGSTMEGGDQAIAVLTLLLIPITLTDPRQWHWQAAPASTHPTSLRKSGRALASLVALSAALAIRVQVSGIYFHASVAKLLVTEWQDGTAMYYWLNSPVFGAPLLLRGMLAPLLRHAGFLAAITWSPIAVELLLFMGIIASRPARRVLLVLGIGLHLGILILMGLFTFSLVMFGALLLYLRPFDLPLALPRVPSGTVMATWFRRFVLRRPSAKLRGVLIGD